MKTQVLLSEQNKLQTTLPSILSFKSNKSTEKSTNVVIIYKPWNTTGDDFFSLHFLSFLQGSWIMCISIFIYLNFFGGLYS